MLKNIIKAVLFTSICLVTWLMGISGCSRPSGSVIDTEQDSVQNISPDTSISTVSFVLDSLLAKTAVLGSSACSISVTDSKGIKWQLQMPGSGWYRNTAITATPFSTVQSSDSLWNITCGVMFSPDGFNFIEPATITIEVPGDTAGNYFFYLIDNTGSKVSFADFTKTAPGLYRVTVNHFSGVGGGESGNLDERCQAAMEYHESVLAKTRKFLETAVGNSAVPPDISNLCKDEDPTAGEASQNDYAEKFLSPEFEYVNSLTTSLRGLQLCYDGGQYDAEAMGLVCQVLDRLQAKSLALIQQYSANDKKFTAVSYAVMGVARRIATAGCIGADAKQQAVLDAVTTYAKTCRDYWKTQLVEQHDLEAYYPAKEFHRKYLVAGGVDDGFEEKLGKAMSFSLTVTLFAQVGVSEDAVDIQGEGTINMEMEGFDGPIFGSGTITWQKGTIATSCGNPSSSCPSNLTSSGFPVDVLVEYDACESPDSVHIISPLTYSAAETWDMCGNNCERKNKSLSGEQSYTHSLCVMPFLAPPNAFWSSVDNKYTFRLLISKAATLVDKEYEPAFGPGTDVKVHLTLKHTPK